MVIFKTRKSVMSKRKICVVITARPSYSRVKAVLQAIKEHPQLELQLVVSGSALLDRYGTAINFIEKDGFEVVSRVFNVLEGENLMSAAKTTGIAYLSCQQSLIILSLTLLLPWLTVLRRWQQRWPQLT